LYNVLPSGAQVAAFGHIRILQGQVYSYLDCELNVTMSVRSKRTWRTAVDSCGININIDYSNPISLPIKRQDLLSSRR